MTARLLLCLLLPAVSVLADGAADNIPDNARRQPPPVVDNPDDVRKSLTHEPPRIGTAIEAALAELNDKPAHTFLPYVQIFHKAVDWALRYDEFYDVKQTDSAVQQLK